LDSVLVRLQPHTREQHVIHSADYPAAHQGLFAFVIGYVKIAFFPGVNEQRFARELDHALGGIRDCMRLIVDLRGILGGLVGSLRLMSYLTPDRVPVGYSLTRKGEIANGNAINLLASTSCQQRGSRPSRWLFGF
jgi:C-terminal processing protease CtpA/Prc